MLIILEMGGSRGQEGQRVLFTRYPGYLQESVTPVSLKRKKHGQLRARASHSGSAGLLGWEEGPFSRYQSLRVGWEGDGGEGFCGLGWKEAASPGRPLRAQALLPPCSAGQPVGESPPARSRELASLVQSLQLNLPQSGEWT